MKRDTMFVTRNILTRSQEQYHNKLKEMGDGTKEVYYHLEDDNTTIGGIEPRDTMDHYISEVANAVVVCCNYYDYKDTAMQEILSSIESSEVTFIISCLMRNLFLDKSMAARDVMYKMLMALKTQIIDIHSFVIYKNTKISCNQWSVLVLVNVDNQAMFNKAVTNIEFMLSNSDIMHPKVIKLSDYNPDDYVSPYKFEYNTFTNELSIDMKDMSKNFISQEEEIKYERID